MAHTNWYRYGTISINKNSNHVIGLNTRWADIGIKSGDIFTLDGLKIYEVDTVTDNANLTLKTAFEESSAADAHYCIIRNFTDITTADIVAQMSELQVEMKEYIDTEMSTLQGKSAYELAQDNGFIGTESEWLASLNAYGVAKKGGYTGTQEEWLESLKAAGEWSSANTRIAELESRLAIFPAINAPAGYTHNLFPRFKNLGNTITDAQWAMINNETYDDLYIGDYWTLPVQYNGETKIMTAIIAQVSGHNHGGNGITAGTSKHLHIALSTGIQSTFWDPETQEALPYKQSYIRTQILPGILAGLKDCIGEAHVAREWVEIVSGSYDSGGHEDEQSVATQIELFRLDEVCSRGSTLKADQWQYADPLALFMHHLACPCPLYFHTWLQETEGSYAYYMYPRYDINSLMLKKQDNIQWETGKITAHVIFIP